MADTSTVPDYLIIGAWPSIEIQVEDRWALETLRCVGCRGAPPDLHTRYRRGGTDHIDSQVWSVHGVLGEGGFGATKRFLEAIEEAHDIGSEWQILDVSELQRGGGVSVLVYAVLGAPRVLEVSLNSQVDGGWKCTVCDNYCVTYTDPRVVYVSAADVPDERPRVLTIGSPRSTVELAVRRDLAQVVSPLLGRRDQLFPVHIVDPSDVASRDELPERPIDREVPWSPSDIEW